MKNKLKRLQLLIRNYDKKGLVFCAAFVLTLQALTAFVPKMGTYADPADLEELFEADARITIPVAGATPDMNIVATDSDKYSVSISSWYLHEDPYSDLTADSQFEEHKDYALRFIFEAKDGYTFREDTVFTLNGESTLKYGSTTQREYVFQDVQSESILPSPRHTSTFLKTASSVEEVSLDTDLVDYINNKRIEWSNSEMGQGVDGDYREAWEALYVMEGGIYKYPRHLVTYFTGTTIDETCGGTIVVGDPDSLIGGGCVIFNYRVEYEEVTVMKPTFTVKFDDGGVFSEADKLLDQTVTGGEVPDEPQNAAGTSLYSILGYCYNSPDSDCYNSYRPEGFYIDPEFTIPYEGEPITQDTTIYIKWLDDFDGYDRIKEIDISITPPEAGTEIVIEDEDNPWSSQKPRPNIALLNGDKFQLWGGSGIDYAYWLKGKTAEEYEPFIGTIEKGGKHYLEIWFTIKDGELAIFDENLILKIDGNEVPFWFSDYTPNDLGLVTEIDIPNDETTAASPDTGVITGGEASATLAIFGTIVTSLVFAVVVVVVYTKRQNQ